MTQRELAAAAGVHLNTISNLEAGETQRPSAQVAAKLQAALGQEQTPEVIQAGYDKHTQAGLDLIGAYLMRLPEDERLERILHLTRHLIAGPRGM